MRWLSLILGAAMVLLAPSVHAQGVDKISKSGAWSMLQGTSADNVRLCTMSTLGPGGGASFHIKHYQGMDHLIVHIAKHSWDIPEGSSVNVGIKIGKELPWLSESATAGGNMIQMNLGLGESGSEAMKLFMQELRSNDTAKVYFFDGEEEPWVISLIGTSQAEIKFKSCIKTWSNVVVPGPESRGTTQPFGRNKPLDQPTKTETAGPVRRS